MKNIKTPYKSQEKVMKLFDDYSRIVFEAQYKTKYGEGLKILTPKQMLQRVPIAPAQVKAANKSDNLISEIRQIIYCLYRAKENITILTVYNNIMNSVKVYTKMKTIFMNSEKNKTSAPHRLLLNLTYKIDLRRKDKYITLLNLSIC